MYGVSTTYLCQVICLSVIWFITIIFPHSIIFPPFLYRQFADIILELVYSSTHYGTYGEMFCDDLRWLCCAPLVHFLQGKSEPFKDLKPSFQFRSDEWWGLEGFGPRKRKYMRATQSQEK